MFSAGCFTEAQSAVRRAEDLHRGCQRGDLHLEVLFRTPNEGWGGAKAAARKEWIDRGQNQTGAWPAPAGRLPVCTGASRDAGPPRGTGS